MTTTTFLSHSDYIGVLMKLLSTSMSIILVLICQTTVVRDVASVTREITIPRQNGATFGDVEFILLNIYNFIYF